jgi:hypothetical protein
MFINLKKFQSSHLQPSKKEIKAKPSFKGIVRRKRASSRKIGNKKTCKVNKEVRINLFKMDPDSDTEDLTGHQKLLGETANYRALQEDELNNHVLDFSPCRDKNRWKMIYNSLFKRTNDKRIIMKKFIEVQRRERLRSMHSSSSSPKKKRKMIVIKDDSSPDFTPFV